MKTKIISEQYLKIYLGIILFSLGIQKINLILVGRRWLDKCEFRDPAPVANPFPVLTVLKLFGILGLAT